MSKTATPTAACFLRIALIVVACCAVLSCNNRPAPDDSTIASDTSTPSALAARWPFWPMHMIIHPLTMIARDYDTGEPLIEARVEFRDEYGHTVKSVGQFRFELYRPPPGTESFDEGMAETVWNRDLRDLELNTMHFDTVTLTYLFRLETSEALDQGDGWRLRVYFLSIDGRRFAAHTDLR